jgi:hypothetical protein
MHALLVSFALTLSAPRLGVPWRTVAPGVETAPASELGGDASWAARVVLVDPGKVEFLVRYDSNRPTLAEWRKRFPHALAVVNGSFYSLEGNSVRPTCDLVAEGVPVKGAGCRRQDALFFGARPRGDPAASTPMVSRPPPSPARLVAPHEFKAEQWVEALKSFPALVRAGLPACSGAHYCAETSRTAAIAQMRDGRILLFASQWPAVRRDVGRWMAEQLGASDALNLDGGPEATLALRGESADEAIGTQGVGLPMVLLVVPR